MDIKFNVLALLLCATVCYGQFQHNHHRESTSENILKEHNENSTLIPVLQHSYSDDSGPRLLISLVSTVILALIIGCVFCCCRCRRQMNQGVVLNLHPTPIPASTTQIIIQQDAVSPKPSQLTAIPPPYPSQEHVPPPYDTQPMWGPPPLQQQQQFNQPPPQDQFPTSFVNPNYGQSPVNMQDAQEKY